MSSDIAEGATPVLIPNTAVKPFKVDGTALAREWESRTLLDLIVKPRSLFKERGFLCMVRKIYLTKIFCYANILL